MVYRVKPCIKKLSYKKRHLGLTCDDRVSIEVAQRRVNMATRALEYLATLQETPETVAVAKLLELLRITYWCKWFRLLKAPPALNQRARWVKHVRVTIDSFNDADIVGAFRFRSKADLKQVLHAFRLPAVVHINGHTFHREELFLVSLYRLHSPNTIGDLCWPEVFHVNYTQVSMMFNYFIGFMCRHWEYLVTDNLQFWKDKLPGYNAAIRAKLASGENPVEFPPAQVDIGFRVCCFLDNTIVPVCRPGGGPVHDGPGAPRKNPILQKTYYTGWKKLHGIKMQTVDAPCGMNMYVFCPYTGGHNDLWVLNESELNEG
jgi:hypothetical protein